MHRLLSITTLAAAALLLSSHDATAQKRATKGKSQDKRIEKRESTTGKKPRVVRPTRGTKGPYRDLKIAMALVTQARISEARKLLEKITAAIPEHAEAWHLFATCYELEQKMDKAHACARKALERMPEHARAALLLARLHRVDDPMLAADYARRAHKHAKKDVVVARGAARILMETGQLDEATRIVDRLAKEGPSGQRLVTLQAELALARRDLPNARRFFAKLTKLRPHDAVPHENIAGIDAALGQLDRAIESLERALAIRPGKTETRLRLIELLTRVGAGEDRIAAERAKLKQRAEDAEAPDAKKPEAPGARPRR